MGAEGARRLKALAASRVVTPVYREHL
eukprot:COSAG01_NODE_41694_length_448_cov_1.037249_1_plen_26_part_01